MELRTTQQTLSNGEVAAQCAELVASLGADVTMNPKLLHMIEPLNE